MCGIGIIFCLVFVPATSIVGFFPSLWQYESARNSSCPLYMGLEICYTSFSFTDAFLASNRLVAVCFPRHYDTWQTPKISYAMVAASWLISITLVALNVLEVGGHYVQLWDFTCQAEPTNSFGLVLFAVSGTGPYFLIGIFSLIIFTTAHIKSRGLRAQMASSTSARHQLRTLQRKLVIARAMGILLVWSFITQIPFTVVPMYVPRLEEEYYDLWRFLRIFPLTQYALSPNEAAIQLNEMGSGESSGKSLGSEKGAGILD
ncbi:hypothetical protein RvY_04268 [Ramazzottius varieornatus]|uniref:G-protein coupled receptors family 1 profile domain-containing protein n=1 Tax=Ramazzottius varieornatus TaxID=947166 RepID=A0A1D1URR7_RAMVA|nr:hypothetical protein RvY_04268 [Ramazzottius varieornatus]